MNKQLIRRLDLIQLQSHQRFAHFTQLQHCRATCGYF